MTINTLNVTPVLVYGSLLSGLGNHSLISRHPECFAYGGRWQTQAGAALVSCGSFPGLWMKEFGDQEKQIQLSASWWKPVRGEIYFATDRGLKLLDRLEGHPDFYFRTRIGVMPELMEEEDRRFEWVARCRSFACSPVKSWLGAEEVAKKNRIAESRLTSPIKGAMQAEAYILNRENWWRLVSLGNLAAQSPASAPYDWRKYLARPRSRV